MHYLVKTFPRQEDKVESRVIQMGFDAYLPRYEGKPFFPSYMFINAKEANLYDLNRVHGSVGVIKFGSDPAWVPDWVVDGLKATAWQRSEDCAPGTRVRTNDIAGAFKDIEALVHEKKNDRIILLIQMMGRQQKITVPFKAVQAV